MSVVAAPFEYSNVRQGRSCGAFTTTAIVPTPRPVSARGTPRMGTASGRPSDPHGIALDARGGPDGPDGGLPSSRRQSTHAKYRESWTDTTDARDMIAREQHHHQQTYEPHPYDAPRAAQVSMQPGRPRPLRPESASVGRLHRGPTLGARPSTASLRPSTCRSELRDVNALLVGVPPPTSARAAEQRAAKVRRQQAEGNASRRAAARGASATRVPGAANLTADQRMRALKIMLTEDREAAAFVATAESFHPEAVNRRARQREAQLERQKGEAVRQELLWAELRRDHTRAQMDQLRTKLYNAEHASPADGGLAAAAAAGGGSRGGSGTFVTE